MVGGKNPRYGYWDNIKHRLHNCYYIQMYFWFILTLSNRVPFKQTNKKSGYHHPAQYLTFKCNCRTLLEVTHSLHTKDNVRVQQLERYYRSDT